MLRQVFLALVVVCCLAVRAMATVTITVGNWVGQYDTPEMVIQIMMSSDIGQGIQIAELALEIDNDGRSFAPLITAVDMVSPGTVFGDATGGNYDQQDIELFPTRTQLSFVETLSGDTPASGVLANVTLDTSRIPIGFQINFPIRLFYAPFEAPAVTGSNPGQSTVLIDGSIHFFWIPEPSSIVLALFALAGLGVVAIRRRRVRKSA